MSQFNYDDYQSVVAKAQAGAANTPAVKVGFFKLADDGDEALVRINCSSVSDLAFASVHTLNMGGNKWMKVSCLNPLGSYGGSCPLCKAVEAGNTAISKASKKVYLTMLVAYKDKTTGSFLPATPVVWERPAGFSREVANLLKDYGNLKDLVLKVTRNGVKGDMKTTYSIGFIPVYNKPELVPADFSAFDRFDISRHSYWEKTAEEIETYLLTGSFPEVVRANSTPTAAPQAQSTTQAATAYNQPAATAAPASVAETPVRTAPTATSAPAAAEASTERPARSFTGFQF